MSFTLRTLADGRICCSEEYALCDKCKAHHAAVASDFAPPDSYAPSLALLRSAKAQTFADRYAEERASEFAAEYAVRAADAVAPRVQSDAWSEYPPPDPWPSLRAASTPPKMEYDANGIADPYAAGIRKLQEENR